MSCPRCGTPIPVISFSQGPLLKCSGCNSRFRKQGSAPSRDIPLPPTVAKLTGCPSCGAPRPPADQRITLNDGGSILCWKCATSYHVCVGGESRTGFSPLTCPYCVMPARQGRRDPSDYVGNFYAGKVEKPKGDYVGDFCVKRH